MARTRIKPTDELYLSREQVLAHALRIAKRYIDDDIVLSLRTLYYRFVAEGLLGSGQQVYKRIGDILTDARYEGDFPVEWLTDSGRDVNFGDGTRCDIDMVKALRQSGSLIRGLPEYLVQTDRWYNQNAYVNVWFEKEALAGTFGPVCDELGVGWFACKGYPSVSALYAWLKQAHFVCGGQSTLWRYRFGDMEEAEYSVRHSGTAKRCVILYAGDHDPDGWEIPRSSLRNLNKLMRVKGLNVKIEMKRVALNMDQIEQYDPPPFEAKVTSARYQGYIDEHGTEDAWELDALEPTVLRDLIREEVAAHWDEAVFKYEQKQAKVRQARLRKMMRNPDWFGGVLGKDDPDDDGGDDGGEAPDLFDDMDEDEGGEE